MNKKALLILVVAAGALLLAVIILLIVARSQAPQANDTTTDATNETTTTIDTTTSTTTETTGTTTTPDTDVVINDAIVDDASSITRLARNFTERYTSYSTDTNYANIEESRDMMTAQMSTQADQVIANDQQDNTVFYSVVSQATNVSLTDFVAGATGATIEVSVRQTLTTGQANPTYQNRTARLTMKKEGVTWKVDSFRWL